MRYTITLCSLVISYTVVAQESPYKFYDFSKVDPAAVDYDRIGQQVDSIYRNSGYDSLLQLYQYAKDRTYTEKYVCFSIGYRASFASLDHLTTGLASLGFDDLSETFGGVPWGVEIRGKKLLFGYMLTPVIRNSVSNADYTIDVRGIEMEISLGFDLINLKRIQFYPQVGLALQDLDIDVMRKSANVDITDVEGMVLQPAGSQLDKSSFVLTYGAELDYHLAYSTARQGIILGLRYGFSTPIVEGKFKVNGKTSSYESADRIATSFFSAVLKFYLKR
jgi:hypothetical protein